MAAPKAPLARWRQRSLMVSVAAMALLGGCSGGTTQSDAATTAAPSSSSAPSAPARADAATTTMTTATTSPTSTSTSTTTTMVPFDATEPMASYVWSIESVDEARLGLSWRPGCPVGPEDLRLVRMRHHTFDGGSTMGEMIVHRSIAPATAEAFGDLWAMGFAVNRVETADAFLTESDIAADGSYISEPGPDLLNVSAAFMCRYSTGSTTKFSEHSYGTAIDINPVQNPYIKGDTIIPTNGLVDRDANRIGTLVARSAAVRAFTSRGLVWGGTWRSLKDYMHFSVSGR